MEPENHYSGIWLSFYHCIDRSDESPFRKANNLRDDQRNDLELEKLKDYTFWQGQPCNKDQRRCRAESNGQCEQPQFWGVEGYITITAEKRGCEDKSDQYRPIVKEEEAKSKVWRTRPMAQDTYNSLMESFHVWAKESNTYWPAYSA